MSTTQSFTKSTTGRAPSKLFATVALLTISAWHLVVHPTPTLATCYCSTPTTSQCRCTTNPPASASFSRMISGIEIKCDSQLEANSLFATKSPICGSSPEILPYCASVEGHPEEVVCYGYEFVPPSTTNIPSSIVDSGKRILVPGEIIFNGVSFGSNKQVFACNSGAFCCARSDVKCIDPGIPVPRSCPDQATTVTPPTNICASTGSGPGANNMCVLEPTGKSPADYVYADPNPSLDLRFPYSWTYKKRSNEDQLYSDVANGSTITVLSEFPGDPSAGDRVAPGLDTQREINTKIPYLKEIWEGLFHNPNSIYRTLLPKRKDLPSYYSQEALDRDWPAEGSTPYTWTDIVAGAGNNQPGALAKMYFKYLYVLNLVTQDVIRSTNPKSAQATTLLTNAGRSISPGSPYTGSTPADLEAAIREAAARFNTPACVLRGVAKIEGSHLFRSTPQQIQSWLAPGGIDPNNCTPNPWGAAGPMQFRAGPWYNWPHADGTRGYGSAIMETDPSYADPATPGFGNICNLRSALWAASKKLSTDSVNPPTPQNGYISGPIHPATGWSEAEIKRAGFHYYGSCVNDAITQKSLGMSYCDFLAKECTCLGKGASCNAR